MKETIILFIKFKTPLILFLIAIFSILIYVSCKSGNVQKDKTQSKTAADILGNPNYHAICYGGYRGKTLQEQPTLDELKEDVRILHAMGVRILRTYKLMFPHAENLVKAIREIQSENENFEMYVMLGAWIDCKNARTAEPIHSEESPQNAEEIERAVIIANEYPDIVKIIAVGNEAMVHWQAGYYVEPSIILKWVNYLQDLKKSNALNPNVWITCSDNFASWGGGGAEYHTPDLTQLIMAVDYVSMHTYPMHDTHYNPQFWQLTQDEMQWRDAEKIDSLMLRSLKYAQSQYRAVVDYMASKGISKPVHIGETGWASASNGFYGADGSKACDEFKQKMYYDLTREWTDEAGISCFFFEAFDEPWKDAQNPGGSENHFGLFTVDGQAKYAVWNELDKGIFDGLTRGEYPVRKTFDGDVDALMETVSIPDVMKEEIK